MSSSEKCEQPRTAFRSVARYPGEMEILDTRLSDFDLLDNVPASSRMSSTNFTALSPPFALRDAPVASFQGESVPSSKNTTLLRGSRRTNST